MSQHEAAPSLAADPFLQAGRASMSPKVHVALTTCDIGNIAGPWWRSES